MSTPANRSAYHSTRTALTAPLIRSYLLELLADFQRIAASAHEAVAGGNDSRARSHLVELRVLSKEISRAANELRQAGGGR